LVISGPFIHFQPSPSIAKMQQLAGREHELKTQGAAEAARDPNSGISAKDAEQAIVEESMRAGVVAYQFDPNASPEEKAAQARSVGRCFGVSEKLDADNDIVAITSWFSS
jgi:hypothetical protein